MKLLSTIHIILPLLFFISSASFSVQAADLIDHSSGLFKFQQKLADKGNMQAQYKLGTMYEAGDGVGQNLEQAKRWYGEAAAAGSEQGAMRKGYLEIKERGYDAAKDEPWLNSVQAGAAEEKPESIYLLAQLHQEGIGVKKDLNESLVLYKRIRSSGIANVGEKIAQVNSELDAKRLSKLKAEKELLVAKEKERQRKIEREKANKQKQAKAIEQAKANAEAEKRKRYEAAMKKIEEEQRIIDQQQKNVSEGGAVATVEDEI